MDAAHLTINIVMVISMVAGAIVVGMQIGALKTIISDMREDLVALKKIPVLETEVGTMKEVTRKLVSEHANLREKVAKLHGIADTGRWRIPPINGDDT